MEPQAYHELHKVEPTHWWYRGMRLITEQVLRMYVKNRRDMHILDAGCGVGGNLTALAAYGHSLGMDYSALALRYANESHPGKLAQASVEALPYKNGVFDLVTSFDVLYCWEVEDDAAAIAEFARVLRPGGCLLIRVPALTALRGSHDVVVHGIRRYTAVELREKIVRAGLIPARTTYLNSMLMPLIFIFRKLGQRFGTTHGSDIASTPPWAQLLLFQILSFEAFWIRRGWNFPAGVSVMCLALKAAPLPSAAR